MNVYMYIFKSYVYIQFCSRTKYTPIHLAANELREKLIKQPENFAVRYFYSNRAHKYTYMCVCTNVYNVGTSICSYLHSISSESTESVERHARFLGAPHFCSVRNTLAGKCGQEIVCRRVIFCLHYILSLYLCVFS